MRCSLGGPRVVLIAGLLGLGACARSPVRGPDGFAGVIHGTATGAARFAPALIALDVPPAALRRRAPRLRQCIINPTTTLFRQQPLALAAWPPPALRETWMSGDTGRVLVWALGEPSCLPDSGDRELDEAIARWSRAAVRAHATLHAALGDHAIEHLWDLAGSEQIGPLSPDASAADRDAATQAAEARRKAYCRVAAEIPAARVRGALSALWTATVELEASALRVPVDVWPVERPIRMRTADGLTVVIGTAGADRVGPGWHLWLDPGGDDAVAADAPEGELRVQAAVDLGGQDHYTAGTSGIAGIVGGLSVVIDASGDDAYDGGRWSVGAAAFGGAILLDRGGNDAYAGRSAAVGAAFHGIALLLDAGGRDVYTVGVQGEGFGGPGGVGVLWDGGGDDSYTAGGLAPDTDRDMQHSLSMAQGCGFGLRPDAEGGTGLLLDVAGDDRYRIEVFGQGLGYWGGAGLLWDAAGNDRYLAVQYAQGTGLHFGVGALSDEAGADTYVAGGLAQGCGHDLGIGACIDTAGPDRYTVEGLGVGASSGGGLGMFWDGEGDDVYDASPLTNLGCDASAAERPGFAVHVDAGGRDRFLRVGVQPSSSAPARDGATWFTGRAGVAVNGDSSSPPVLRVTD